MQRYIISDDGKVISYSDQPMPQRGWRVNPELDPLGFVITAAALIAIGVKKAVVFTYRAMFRRNRRQTG